MSEFKIKLKTPTIETKVEETKEVTEITPSAVEETPKQDIPTPKIWVQEPEQPEKSSEKESLVKRPKIQLGSIKADKQKTETPKTEEQKEKTETPKTTTPSEEVETPDLEESTPESRLQDKKQMFWNYQSSFEKRGKKFIDRIKNIHWAPETRLGFLMLLVGLTVFIIGGLMILIPEKHSFSIYKASLQEIYAIHVKWGSPIPSPKVVQSNEKLPNPEPTPSPIEQGNISQETNIGEDEKREKVKEYILQNLKK